MPVIINRMLGGRRIGFPSSECTRTVTLYQLE
jgi:hypothetical protein